MLNLKEKKKDEGTAKMGTDFNVVSILKVQSWIQARDKMGSASDRRGG